jgi:hypothetical protein
MATAERACARPQRIVFWRLRKPKMHMNITAVTPAQMVHAAESGDWQRRCQRCAPAQISLCGTIPLSRLVSTRGRSSLMTHYVMVLGGHTDELKDIAPFFTGDSLRIRHVENRWVMESSDLDASTPEEVSGTAFELLSRFHQLLALYIGLFSPFTIDGIIILNDRGERVSTMSGPVQLRITVRRRPEVLGPAGPGSLGSRVLSRASDDPAIREALSLVGHDEPLSWPRIYDIIEFLGNTAISKSGLASKTEVDRFRRTANHFRHLGNPRAKPLPPNDPDLRHARTWAYDLIMKWIAKRL